MSEMTLLQPLARRVRLLFAAQSFVTSVSVSLLSPLALIPQYAGHEIDHEEAQ